MTSAEGGEMSSATPWETEVYARGRQINRWPHTEVVSRVLRATADQDRQAIRILELGCGTGNNLRFLAEEGFHANGIDASSTAVEKARQLLEATGLTAEIEIGDLSALPWPDAHFDLVLDRAALVHNSRDRIRVILSEVHRVLGPGGRLISIGLKSIRHPDLRFGKRIGEGTWSDFTEGKFHALGAMSFFDEHGVEALFKDFEIVSLERITRRDLHDEIRDEEFVAEVLRR
jgi:SAM-dependent methyltransferase